MDEQTAMLLGAAFDDELAGIDDELEEGYEGYDVGEGEWDEEDLLDQGFGEDELGAFRLPRFIKRAGRAVIRAHDPRVHYRMAKRAVRSGRRMISPRRRSSLLARRDRIQASKRAYINKIQPAIPGVPLAGARNFPLGFGSITFLPGGLTQFNLVANPQRPFKGARLVIDVRRSAGAVAELVTVTSLNIGQNNQLVSSAALPAEAFRPDGFDTVLSLDPATPGIDITLGLAISASPGAGESVAVSAMIIGDTIG